MEGLKADNWNIFKQMININVSYEILKTVTLTLQWFSFSHNKIKGSNKWWSCDALLLIKGY